MENMKILSRESDEDISDDDAFVYNGDNGFTFKKKNFSKVFFENGMLDLYPTLSSKSNSCW